MNKCKDCRHFTMNGYYMDVGSCALMGDSNDLASDENKKLGALPDRVYGWDHESYSAGVYVGPKFGCIHWAQKG